MIFWMTVVHGAARAMVNRDPGSIIENSTDSGTLRAKAPITPCSSTNPVRPHPLRKPM